jgi:hypothetical protein
MLLGRHVARLLADLVAFSVVTRRVSLLVAVALGLVLVAIAFAGQTAAPFVVYPFV